MFPAAFFFFGNIRKPIGATSDQRLTPLPLLWFAFVFLFFSLSTGKREIYLMPLYPAMALTVGQYFSAAPYLERRPYRLAQQALSFLMVLGCLGLGLLTWKMAGVLGGSAGPLIGLFPLLAVPLAWTLFSDRVHLTGLVLAGVTATLLWTLALSLPQVEPYRDVKPLALEIRRQAGPADLVGSYGTHKPSFAFYVGRRPFHACSQQEMEKILRGRRRVFLLASEAAFESLRFRAGFPLEVLALGTSLSFGMSKWSSENASPFTRTVLAVSRPLDSSVWQPDPSRPYINCEERARGVDQP